MFLKIEEENFDYTCMVPDVTIPIGSHLIKYEWESDVKRVSRNTIIPRSHSYYNPPKFARHGIWLFLGDGFTWEMIGKRASFLLCNDCILVVVKVEICIQHWCDVVGFELYFLSILNPPILQLWKGCETGLQKHNNTKIPCEFPPPPMGFGCIWVVL